MRLALILFLFLTGPLAACPVAPDTSEMENAMLAELAAAETYSSAQKAVGAVWKHWQTAPDTHAQELLDEGLSRIRQSDLENAKAILTELAAYCPHYAEGYNQLAFAHFLANDLDASEKNLKKALELEPRHFGALSGLGLIAHSRGNLPVAKIWIAKAVKLHPYLNERVILGIPEKAEEL